MSDSSFTKHGVSVIEKDDGARVIAVNDTGVIGVVCTAPDADRSVFPFNTPVQMTGVSRYLDKAGSTGTLPMVLDAIKDHGEPMVHVVCVPVGANEAETLSNVVGGRISGQYTGLQSLLSCKGKFGVKPRILGAPGFDLQTPVAQELGIIAGKIRGFAYVGLGGEDMEHAVTARKAFGNKRMLGIWPEVYGWDTATSTRKTMSASARALGLRAKIDRDLGWHYSLSNQQIMGIDGITKDVSFDLAANDPTDTHVLNKDCVTTIINENGYQFWGLRTFSDDPRYAFESVVRSLDFLADAMAYSGKWAMDKPMSLVMLKEVIDERDQLLKRLAREGKILGGECFFPQNLNDKAAMANGEVAVQYRVTPAYPMEHLKLYQTMTQDYLEEFIVQLSGI